jgi:hypothetical protein
MKTNKTCLIHISILITLILAGCTSSDQAPSPTNTIAYFPAPTIKPTSIHYQTSRTKAVPLGAKASVGVFDLLITGLIRPATEKVLAASSANPSPEEGMEYVLVDLVEVCKPPVHQECFIRVSDMRLIGSSGIERRPKHIIGEPFLLPNRHIFGGDTAYGYVAFVVDQDETDLVFFFESDSKETVYLATE